MGGAPPPDSVVRAFQSNGADVRPLPGGRGSTWRAGDLVLKRADGPAEAQWVAHLAESLCRSGVDGFRCEQPVRARNGAWSVRGWTAWRYLAGTHRFDRWPQVMAAGAALHTAMAGTPRPDFLDSRRHAWARADKMAWGETRPELGSADVQIAAIRLAQYVVRSTQPAQAVHADLTGNVLFEDDLAPAIIDLTIYWRPAAYPLAVVAVDALSWHGADESVLELVPPGERSSMIARAALFRLFTADVLRREYAGAEKAFVDANVDAAERVAGALDRAPFSD